MPHVKNRAETSSTEQALPPEVESLLAVHLLYWKSEKEMGCVNIDPPLSKNERHLIVRLEHPSRIGSLAQAMILRPSTLTSIVDSLEAGKFLTRQIDPSDRRASLLHLTQKGEDTRAKLVEKAATFFASITGLTQKETEEFAALSKKIKTHILLDGVPEDLNL